MRDLIDAFFRERSIVNHHIASFNDFLPTIDNPNSRMQRIVDNLRSAPEDERHGGRFGSISTGDREVRHARFD